MRLWEKGEAVDGLVAAFTVGDDPEVDLRWAWHDVIGSAAHVRTQLAAGLLSREEANGLLAGLAEILSEIEANRFVIPYQEEDVHTAVEARLTERIGALAGKLHTGRSRNDQVLTDLRLWLREQLGGIAGEWRALIEAWLGFAERYGELPLTGYTHLQQAMPSSFGLWAGGFAGALLDAWPLLSAAESLADRCPLGSAAGYGSPLPLDRSLSARLLGFGAVELPVTACQVGRGVAEGAALSALSAATAIIGRFAWDVCLYASTEFSLLTLPTAFTTGSSIMPQKRNPDVAELLRASAAKVRAARREIEDIAHPLPSGYHRDLQLSKAPLVRGVETARACLVLAAHLTAALQPRVQPLDPVLYATAEALRRPEPFRDAYRAVAAEVRAGTFTAAPAPAPTWSPSELRNRLPTLAATDLRAQWRRLLEPLP